MLSEKYNNPMNRFNQYLKHKGHLERLYLSKSLINDKFPIIPSFFKNGVKNRGTILENKYKITNEHKSLFKRLKDVVNKQSKYSHSMNIPSKCPAFERKDKIQIKRFKNIIRENNSFYKILTRVKSSVDNTKNEEDYLHSRYLKKNIIKNNISNPNLNFPKYRQYSKNMNHILREKSFNRTMYSPDIKKNRIQNKRFRITLTGFSSKSQVSIGFY